MNGSKLTIIIFLKNFKIFLEIMKLKEVEM